MTEAVPSVSFFALAAGTFLVVDFFAVALLAADFAVFLAVALVFFEDATLLAVFLVTAFGLFSSSEADVAIFLATAFFPALLLAVFFWAVSFSAELGKTEFSTATVLLAGFFLAAAHVAAGLDAVYLFTAVFLAAVFAVFLGVTLAIGLPVKIRNFAAQRFTSNKRTLQVKPTSRSHFGGLGIGDYCPNFAICETSRYFIACGHVSCLSDQMFTFFYYRIASIQYSQWTDIV